MNIVILNGSPRSNGNTASMVESFSEGTKEAGHHNGRQVIINALLKKERRAFLQEVYVSTNSGKVGQGV